MGAGAGAVWADDDTEAPLNERGRMRILSWNLNHRATRRPIPAWIADAIAAQSPDVLALNEYVDARNTATCRSDHERFFDALDAMGLTHRRVTTRVGRSNHRCRSRRASRSRRARSLPRTRSRTRCRPTSFTCGSFEAASSWSRFRCRAYEYANRHKKRLTWDWLIDALAVTRQRPGVLIGDMNTGPGDSEKYCGDSLGTLAASGWTVAVPSRGYSWRLREGSPERRIDLAFHTPALRCERVAYSWDFHALDERARRAPVGLPDHAMLIVDVERSRGDAVQGRTRP